MSIVGVGIDIVDSLRIKKILKHFNDRFAKRILSRKEMIEYNNHKKKSKFLSNHFAVKESAMKALGTGFRQGIFFNQFEIVKCLSGKPKINLLGKSKIFANFLNVKNIFVSISDEKKYSVAIVILES
ncbi:hypothetical protein AOQ88_01130 [Candidatus Riesia sp. GBBU]|nr:hypothetical protein AOQ88_01130 [Candidatus Riesia sp. GBBU]